MPVNPTKLESAMQQIEKLLNSVGYNTTSPIMKLLQEARAYAGEVSALQSGYIELVKKYLVCKKIFDWERSNQTVAIDQDVRQYEELLAYCLVAGDKSLLDWGVNQHKNFVKSTILKSCAQKLQEKKVSRVRKISTQSVDSAKEMTEFYDYLIKLLAAG